MKVIWEVEDLTAGRKVGRPQRSEQWMIGYMTVETGNQPALISTSDGMVQVFKTKTDLVARLNSSEEVPVEFFEKTKG